jgi:uncharacterized protein YcfJ
MKRAALLAVFATAAVAAQAQPQFQPVPPPQFQPPPQSFVDRAQVQNVEPQYENVAVPRQECTSQWVAEPPVAGGSGYAGAIIGGVAGGILGNQVGKGHGKEAATAAGAVIGAFTGDRIANSNPQPQYQGAQREVRSCRTVHDMQPRLTGYKVNYTYAGHQYTTYTREQPGNSLPVRVSVMPELR